MEIKKHRIREILLNEFEPSNGYDPFQFIEDKPFIYVDDLIKWLEEHKPYLDNMDLLIKELK